MRNKYWRHWLFISDMDLNRLIENEPEGPQKTGAPGRPSSMGIVLAEFERRRLGKACESSREAEANALAAWLRRTHPTLPPLTAKSIRNKLPTDFQPYNRHRPKL